MNSKNKTKDSTIDEFWKKTATDYENSLIMNNSILNDADDLSNVKLKIEYDFSVNARSTKSFNDSMNHSSYANIVLKNIKFIDSWSRFLNLFEVSSSKKILMKYSS